MHIIVTADKNDPTCGTLAGFGAQHKCRLGRGGVSAAKQEGDGTTPLGTFLLRALWHRPDIYPAPQTGLACRPITPQSGWSDDPKDKNYNRPVTLPHNFSHETLWREGGAYDLLIPLSYNDDPPIAGKGSAIFFHLTAKPDAPTQGCVAIAANAMVSLLPHLTPRTILHIRTA